MIEISDNKFVVNNEDFIFNKIKIVSFILAIIILFMHSKNIHLYSNINIGVIYFETFMTYTLGPLAVPTFFMISGYLFFRSPVIAKNPKENIINWVQKLKRRFSSLVIPYICWNLIDYALFLIISLTPIGILMATENIPFSMNELISSILFYKYNSVYWYMAQLILFCVASIFLYFILKQPYSILFVLIFTTLSIIFSQDIFRFNSFAFWVLGSWLGIHKPSLFLNKRTTSQSTIAFILCIIVLLIRFMMDNIFGISNDFLGEYLLLINVILLWFSFDVIPYTKINLKWWQDITFFIYSSHPLIIDGLKKVLVYILPPSSVSSIIIYFVAVILTVLIIIVIAQILRKYISCIWNILNGNRNKV